VKCILTTRRVNEGGEEARLTVKGVYGGLACGEFMYRVTQLLTVNVVFVSHKVRLYATTIPAFRILYYAQMNDAITLWRIADIH